MRTLYETLRAHSHGLCQWMPAAINRRCHLPATPARLSWALRVLRAGSYPSRILAERMTGRTAAPGADAAASVLVVLSNR